VILGGFIIQSFDRILAPELTSFLNQIGRSSNIGFLADVQLSNWRYFIFGAALVILMLVRPEGLMPSRRAAAELHPDEGTIQGEDEPPGGIEQTPQELAARQTAYDMRELDESPREDR
jgi:branched-chain amino acid transport system permease protein